MANIAVLDTRERVFVGILLTSTAYLLFSLQDASIKLLVTAVTVWQIMFFRSVTILVACAAAGGRAVFADTVRSPIVGAMFVRSLFTLAAWLCYYTAAKYLQLAELTTIYYAAPVIVTVLSIPLLGERVPATRWLAVLTGFVGVFIACDPVELGLSRPMLLVLAAACLWALAIVLLRKTALQERTIIQLVLNNAYFLIFSALPAWFLWHMPSGGQWLLLLSVGVLGGVAQLLLFEGMKRAPISVLAPFEYTSLVWSFALGFLIWGDVPRSGIFVGAAFIVSAGLVIVAGEHRRKPSRAG